MTIINDIASETQEIQRLVTTACQQGKPDQYTGKRQWMRFSAGMRLEASVDPSNPSASLHVVMQNVSEGGCAFWCKRGLDEHVAVYIREFSTDGDGEWIKGQVRHCTVGIRGYLVGAEFENPPSETQFAEPAEKAPKPSRPPVLRTSTGKRLDFLPHRRP